MRVINPLIMTDAQLIASNVTEDDYGEWDVSTTYDADDQVIDLTAHKIYQSVQGSNIGQDPTSDDGTWWLEVSYTNRWKAFDARLADQVSRANYITYTIQPASVVTGIAFFNLDAAKVRVQVFDDESPANQVYGQTVELVDDTDITDWLTLFTTDLDSYLTEVLFSDLLALPSYQIVITIGDGTGTPEVGEIAMGRIVSLGETMEGTSLGLTSFSTKEQDTFGNWAIVSRAKSDPVNFTFAMEANDAARVKRVLNSLRDTPAVYFAHEELVGDYGAISYGFFQDYEIPLRRNGVSTVQLEVEGLT